MDEVFGMDNKNGNVWLEMARQIFSEQLAERYRVIEHFPSGAPYIEGYPGRISVTHTKHFFAVAALPKTPEMNLEVFNVRTAMGIDSESLEREQVVNVRSKFLSESELQSIPENDLTANILAWTAKEALYKAALTPGLDFKNNLVLQKISSLHPDPEKNSPLNLGEALIIFPNSETENIVTENIVKMYLYSYESYGNCVTIAISPKCARFGKSPLPS